MKELQYATYVSILLALGLYLLTIAQWLLVPFFVALVLFSLIITIANTLYKVRILPYFLALLGSIALCLGVIWGLISLLSSNISTVLSMAPVYQEKLEGFSKQAFEVLGIESAPKLTDLFSDLKLTTLAANLASTATNIAGRTGVILIYILFLLLEYHLFDAKLAALIKDPNNLEKAKKIIQDIASKVQSYLLIKTLASLLTGLASYALLLSFGVAFADFWALFIFLLNFIPTIGSIVATIVVSLMALLQFGELTPFLVFAALLTAIQFTVGNLLEPRIFGKSFNLSPLVIVLFLAIWGEIWGIVGMFLCVPILVMCMIVCSNFEATRPFAILLSESGELGNRGS